LIELAVRVGGAASFTGEFAIDTLAYLVAAIM